MSFVQIHSISYFNEILDCLLPLRWAIKVSPTNSPFISNPSIFSSYFYIALIC